MDIKPTPVFFFLITPIWSAASPGAGISGLEEPGQPWAPNQYGRPFGQHWVKTLYNTICDSVFCVIKKLYRQILYIVCFMWAPIQMCTLTNEKVSAWMWRRSKFWL